MLSNQKACPGTFPNNCIFRCVVQLLLIMNRYSADEEIYTLSVMVVTGILSSHPGLIGAAKRLIPGKLCELLTATMRSQCQQVQASQSRQWMHFSYPYTCRVCVVHCTALYCCLVNNRDFNREALERLNRVQFHGMLQCPPPYLLDSLSLESAVVLPGRGPGEPPLKGSLVEEGTSGDVVTTKVTASTSRTQGKLALSIDSESQEDDQDEEPRDPAELLSPESRARYRMVTAGVFHTAQCVPESVARSRDSIAIGDVAEGDYEGCARNVEYMAYMPRKEKDHIMATLFKMFHVT